MKISIIVPVYKVEKYIDQCVRSVLEQTYPEWEMILVDDGSPDDCPAICEAWARKENRIRVIHKENGGSSSARNSGIIEVTGDYIMFLDSDDYWDDKNCLNNIVEMLQKDTPDVLTFRYKKYIESSGEYLDVLPSCVAENINVLGSKNEILQALLEKGLYLSSACNKVIKAEFLRNNSLYFKEGITTEDIDWCARCMLYASTIRYLNMDSYVYRQRDYSVTHSITYNSVNDLKNNICECVRLGQQIEKGDPFEQIYYTFVAYQYGVFLCTNHMAQDERVKEMVREMESYKWLLRYNSNKKIKMLYYVDKIMGYKNLIRCTKLYTKIRKG